MTTQLNNSDFMKFPLEISAEGSVNSSRREHVREQIEQVLFREIEGEFRFGLLQIFDRKFGLALVPEMSQRRDEMRLCPVLCVWNLHRPSRPGDGLLKIATEKMGKRSV